MAGPHHTANFQYSLDKLMFTAEFDFINKMATHEMNDDASQKSIAEEEKQGNEPHSPAHIQPPPYSVLAAGASANRLQTPSQFQLRPQGPLVDTFGTATQAATNAGGLNTRKRTYSQSHVGPDLLRDLNDQQLQNRGQP